MLFKHSEKHNVTQVFTQTRKYSGGIVVLINKHKYLIICLIVEENLIPMAELLPIEERSKLLRADMTFFVSVLLPVVILTNYLRSCCIYPVRIWT